MTPLIVLALEFHWNWDSFDERGQVHRNRAPQSAYHGCVAAVPGPPSPSHAALLKDLHETLLNRPLPARWNLQTPRVLTPAPDLPVLVWEGLVSVSAADPDQRWPYTAQIEQCYRQLLAVLARHEALVQPIPVLPHSPIVKTRYRTKSLAELMLEELPLAQVGPALRAQLAAQDLARVMAAASPLVVEPRPRL